MNKNSKFILPATILLASLIIGTFILVSQILKQNSIAEQQRIELEHEKQLQIDKTESLEAIKQTKETELDVCNWKAKEKYNINWLITCDKEGKLSLECKDFKEEYLEAYRNSEGSFALYWTDKNLSEDVGKDIESLERYKNSKVESCACKLNSATQWNDQLKEDKDACMKIYLKD